MISIKQHIEGSWSVLTMDKFIEHVGFLQPLRVDTEDEYNWLWSLQLMIGREFLFFKYGQANPSDLPPTLVKIDIPL